MRSIDQVFHQTVIHSICTNPSYPTTATISQAPIQTRTQPHRSTTATTNSICNYLSTIIYTPRRIHHKYHVIQRVFNKWILGTKTMFKIVKRMFAKKHDKT